MSRWMRCPRRRQPQKRINRQQSGPRAFRCICRVLERMDKRMHGQQDGEGVYDIYVTFAIPNSIQRSIVQLRLSQLTFNLILARCCTVGDFIQ